MHECNCFPVIILGCNLNTILPNTTMQKKKFHIMCIDSKGIFFYRYGYIIDPISSFMLNDDKVLFNENLGGTSQVALHTETSNPAKVIFTHTSQSHHEKSSYQRVHVSPDK